jgi:polysaccharide export outer membrane protein
MDFKKLGKFLVPCAVAVSLAACGTVNVVDEQPIESSVGVVDEYLMGIGDAIQISVWRNPDLSVQVTVRPDGKISVPLVGDLRVDGVSTQAVAAQIETELEDFIRNPKVTVIVTNPTSAEYIHRIRVTGAVESQQSLPYRKGITVLDVVLAAGGLTPFANGNEAKLYRQTVDGAKVYPVYLDDILEKGVLDSNYKLFPQDIVTVPERGF